MRENHTAADSKTQLDSLHPYRLGRGFSLGRNKHYQQVYRRGKRQGGRLVVLTYLKARELKIGFSVSAKVGNAITRNRIKRMMREDFRIIRQNLVPGRYILSARKQAAEAEHDAFTRDIKGVFERAGLFIKDGSAT